MVIQGVYDEDIGGVIFAIHVVHALQYTGGVLMGLHRILFHDKTTAVSAGFYSITYFLVSYTSMNCFTIWMYRSSNL